MTKTLFGIEKYDKEYLMEKLKDTKAGRCELRHDWLYFTLYIRGLRGIVGKNKEFELYIRIQIMRRMGYNYHQIVAHLVDSLWSKPADAPDNVEKEILKIIIEEL